MRRLAISVICGLTVTVTLAALAFSEVVSRDTARILLWQCTFLAQGVPHGNIGTPEHPIIEGSPLDLIPVFVGVPLGIPIYALLTYLVLRMVAIVRDRMGQRNHRVP